MPTTPATRALALFLLLLAPFLLATAACGVAEPPDASEETGAAAGDAAGGGVSGAADAGDVAAAPGAGEPTAAAPAAGQPAPAAVAVIAAQETNWPAVVAEVTEFRRRGNTLTTRLRFTNRGEEASEPDVHYDEVYLMDAGAGKKYEVLRDEEGRFIAGLRSGWNDRWYQTLDPGQAYTVWMKFPAPPPEVRAVTLQVPGMPPFEELPIQDS